MDALSEPTPVDVSVFEESGRYRFRSQDGLALYRYDHDRQAISNCVLACAELWPPFLVSAGASPIVGDWKAIPRGTAHQWSYKGAPVYTYTRDVPGGQAGDGIDGAWHVIFPR